MRPSRLLLAGIILSTLSAITAWTQTPPPQPPRPGPAVQGPARDNQVEKVGTAVLAGRVVQGETGKPLRRALVRAFSAETPQGRSVSTDVDGRWQIKALPAGSYRVSVSKGGFVEIGYGQKRPFEGGKVLDLVEGQTIEKVDVSLPRAGVITGQVLDEFGEPVTGARVSAMRYRYVGGQRRLSGMGAGDTTDDIGQYRLHGLAPGEYFVSAAMVAGLMFGQSEDRVGYAQTFYPGTAVQSEAQRVTVSVGQETQQTNIPLSPSRISRISGKAVSASGKPIFRGFLMLASMGAGGIPNMTTGTSLKPDGTFLFSSVTPGEYRIQLQHSPNSDETILNSLTATEFGSVAVTVADRDVTDLLVVTSPGATAAGRVAFEGDAKPTFSPQTVFMGVVPIEFNMMLMSGTVRIREDWSFEATGLSGRRRFRLNAPPPGWYLKSVTHEGTDITDTGLDFKEGGAVSGLEIVLTQRATELSGGVQDANARPVTDYVIVAFSTDSARWGFQSRFIRSARPNQNGRFSIKGLPPDDYIVVALDYLEPGEESDPEQLEQWKTRGTPVTLGNAETKAVTLKLSQ
jgi:hypothetical protein